MNQSKLKRLENSVKMEFINAGNELIGKDLRLVEESVRAVIKILKINANNSLNKPSKLEPMKPMTKNEFQSFIKEFAKLCDKYNIINAAFVGEDKISKKYLGIKSLSNDYTVCFNTLLNIGRLWQTSREGIKEIMGNFEN